MIRFDPRNPRGILWIASYPRSGNTWMRIFLYALRQSMSGAPPEPVRLADVHRFERSDDWLPLYERLAGHPVDRESPEIARLRPQVQMDVVQKNKGIATVKTHSSLLLDRGYPTINPKATIGAVYILRNPLDVAVSYAEFSGESLDLSIELMSKAGFTGATKDHVYSVVGSWSENVASWTEPPNPVVLVVRYEDMVAAPMKMFDSVARHLGLAPTEAQLSRAIEMSSFGNLRIAEDEQGFKERPAQTKSFFREGRVGQWRERLTPDQVSRIVAAHGKTMAKFHYLPD